MKKNLIFIIIAFAGLAVSKLQAQSIVYDSIVVCYYDYDFTTNKYVFSFTKDRVRVEGTVYMQYHKNDYDDSLSESVPVREKRTREYEMKHNLLIDPFNNRTYFDQMTYIIGYIENNKHEFEKCKDKTVYAHPNKYVNVIVFNDKKIVDSIFIWNDIKNCNLPDSYQQLIDLIKRIRRRSEPIYKEEESSF
jgi:hypothetical protein